MRAALEVVAEPEPVHLRHALDGYPLCWTQEQDGDFKGSYEESEVDCQDCKKWLKGG